MLMKELNEKNYISHRLYKYLRVAFQDTPKNFKYYLSITDNREDLPYHERVDLFFNEMEQEFENSSLKKVLSELEVSEPEDIMRFRGLGKKCVSELQTLIERDRNESKVF